MPTALVVDDQPADRLHLCRILEGAGWTVLAASEGADALQIARDRTPDIVFLDIVMPGMDGYQTCRKLSEDARTRTIPVVFVSTKHQRADQLWARMQGARELIAKPCTAEQVLAALRHVG